MSRIIVAGAGIIGLSIAYELTKRGHTIEVFERDGPGNGCSYRNAGMIVPSHFTTLPSPGVISDALRWLTSRKSPFAIKLSPTRSLYEFLWLFYRHTKPGHSEKHMRLLADFHLHSREIYREWASEIPGLQLETGGITMLYRTGKAESEEKSTAAKAEALGIQVQLLDQSGLQAMEPGLELNVSGGAHYPLDARIDPERFMEGLLAELGRRHCSLHFHEEITGLELSGGEIRCLQTAGGPVTGDRYIIATGLWSQVLMKQAGFRMPMQSGKGFSFMLDNPGNAFRIPKLINEARVAVTPLENLVRFGGNMLLGDRTWNIPLNRIRGILNSVSEYFPGMIIPDPGELDIWQGYRPLSPDGLPYIGIPETCPNLLVATGHSMMGVSLAPASARIIADLIEGRNPEIETEALKPDRFNRKA